MGLLDYTRPGPHRLTLRGTSNANARGSSKDRAARKIWLLKVYRADHRVPLYPEDGDVVWSDACRCYRCGRLLTIHTLTVDRIVPGCKGGRYVHNNIRPACASCNSETGGALR